MSLKQNMQASSPAPIIQTITQLDQTAPYMCPFQPPLVSTSNSALLVLNRAVITSIMEWVRPTINLWLSLVLRGVLYQIPSILQEDQHGSGLLVMVLFSIMDFLWPTKLFLVSPCKIFNYWKICMCNVNPYKIFFSISLHLPLLLDVFTIWPAPIQQLYQLIRNFLGQAGIL